MNLDNIAITLRPRTGWQSIDLGFRLARRWFVPLFVLWCVLSVPVYLLCKLAGLPGWLVLFTWWWFKPLYEAPLYYWCSRAVFNEPVTLRQSLSILPRKIFSLLSTYLSLWRLGTARSQNMNVLMIENLKGKTRSARISVISRVTTRTDPLIFICVHIEVAIAYSLVILGFVLLPVSITEDVLWLTLLGQADSVWLATAMEACAVLAAGVVAPFYVCSGFSLYINRRTHLEAWDIDLHFRRMVDRKNRRRQSTGLTTDNSSDPHHSKPATPSTGRQDGAAPAVAASVIGLFLFVIAAIQPGDSVAADAIGVPDDQASHRLINDILDHRDFGSTITKQQLQVIERDEEPEESEPLDFDWEWLNWLIEFIKSVSNVALWIEWVLWGIITVLFAGLVYLVIRNSHHLSRLPAYFGFRGADASQVQLFDLDIAPQSLPDNIPVAATALLNSGRKREAMSLLYRGALSRLVHRYGMQITDSATERQCVDQVGREQPAGRSDVFSSLTSHWLQIAYGRTEVSDSRVTSLCEQWPMAFDSGRFDATEAPARGVS